MRNRKLYVTSSFTFLISLFFLISVTNVATAGCAINLKFKNTEDVRILVSAFSSKVKTKNGAWKKVINYNGPLHIEPGQSKSIPFRATFGCNKNRRYKLLFVKEGTSWYQYYPSASSFTKKTTVSITAKAP